MTNREKYINNASNEELAKIIKFCDTDLCKHNEIGCKNCAVGYKEKMIEWLSQEAELTADEMFEELNYRKSETYEFVMYKIGIHQMIQISKHNYSYCKVGDGGSITEAEDKAIHKKMEEMINETNN